MNSGKTYGRHHHVRVHNHRVDAPHHGVLDPRENPPRPDRIWAYFSTSRSSIDRQLVWRVTGAWLVGILLYLPGGSPTTSATLAAAAQANVTWGSTVQFRQTIDQNAYSNMVLIHASFYFISFKRKHFSFDKRFRFELILTDDLWAWPRLSNGLHAARSDYPCSWTPAQAVPLHLILQGKVRELDLPSSHRHHLHKKHLIYMNSSMLASNGVQKITSFIHRCWLTWNLYYTGKILLSSIKCCIRQV